MGEGGDDFYVAQSGRCASSLVDLEGGGEGGWGGKQESVRDHVTDYSGELSWWKGTVYLLPSRPTRFV